MNYDLIAELPFFLACSLELEKEAAERLRECAELMAAQDQHEVAGIFAELAKLSEKHASEIENICKSRGLPAEVAEALATDEDIPEGFICSPDAPEMSPREAVETMLAQERESAEFYGEVANRTVDPEIRKYATAFAEEEREHGSILERWLNNLEASGAE